MPIPAVVDSPLGLTKAGTGLVQRQWKGWAGVWGKAGGTAHVDTREAVPYDYDNAVVVDSTPTAEVWHKTEVQLVTVDYGAGIVFHGATLDDHLRFFVDPDGGGTVHFANRQAGVYQPEGPSGWHNYTTSVVNGMWLKVVTRDLAVELWVRYGATWTMLESFFLPTTISTLVRNGRWTGLLDGDGNAEFDNFAMQPNEALAGGGPTPPRVPGQITTAPVATAQPAAVGVTWTDPADLGVPTRSSFEIEVRRTSDQVVVGSASGLPVTPRSATVAAPAGVQSRTFVRARNSQGPATLWSPQSNAVTPGPAPTGVWPTAMRNGFDAPGHRYGYMSVPIGDAIMSSGGISPFTWAGDGANVNSYVGGTAKEDWTIPRFRADGVTCCGYANSPGHTPRWRIINDNINLGPIGATLATIHCPDNVTHSNGGDRHVSVYDRDAWRWHHCYCGYVESPAFSTTAEINYSARTITIGNYQGWDPRGDASSYCGTIAAGTPDSVGKINPASIAQIAAGNIEYAFPFTMHAGMRSSRLQAGYIAPANSEDSFATQAGHPLIYQNAPGACRIGCLLFLPPTLNLNSLGLSNDYEWAIAHNAQKWGWMVSEQVGNVTTLRASNGVSQAVCDAIKNGMTKVVAAMYQKNVAWEQSSSGPWTKGGGAPLAEHAPILSVA